MCARDLGRPRVGSAWLGAIEMRDGDDIVTFTAPPGVAPLPESEYERLLIACIVRHLLGPAPDAEDSPA